MKFYTSLKQAARALGAFAYEQRFERKRVEGRRRRARKTRAATLHTYEGKIELRYKSRRGWHVREDPKGGDSE